MNNHLPKLLDEYGLRNVKYYDIVGRIAKFRHYQRVEQDSLIHELSDYPKIQAYLLSILINDIMNNGGDI